jgi:hypothetical protein
MTDGSQSVQVPDLPADHGNVFLGCGIGCGTQVAILLLLLLISSIPPAMSNKQSGILLIALSIGQWFVLGPAIWKMRGKHLTSTGIIISGVVGCLLGSACGYTMMDFVIR